MLLFEGFRGEAKEKSPGSLPRGLAPSQAQPFW